MKTETYLITGPESQHLVEVKEGATLTLPKKYKATKAAGQIKKYRESVAQADAEWQERVEATEQRRAKTARTIADKLGIELTEVGNLLGVAVGE